MDLNVAALSSTRNLISITGTFFATLKQEWQAALGPAKTCCKYTSSTHDRLTSCLALTYCYSWNPLHWPIPTFCNSKPQQGKLYIILCFLWSPKLNFESRKTFLHRVLLMLVFCTITLAKPLLSRRFWKPFSGHCVMKQMYNMTPLAFNMMVARLFLTCCFISAASFYIHYVSI